MAKAKASETAIVPTTSPGAAMISAQEFQAKLSTGKFLVTRDFKFESEGQALHGFFLGAGPPIEMDSKQRPGEKDLVSTWRVRDPGGAIVWQIMGSAGLDKYVATLAPNTELMITYLGKKSIQNGGKQMNDFVVAVAA